MSEITRSKDELTQKGSPSIPVERDPAIDDNGRIRVRLRPVGPGQVSVLPAMSGEQRDFRSEVRKSVRTISPIGAHQDEVYIPGVTDAQKSPDYRGQLSPTPVKTEPSKKSSSPVIVSSLQSLGGVREAAKHFEQEIKRASGKETKESAPMPAGSGVEIQMLNLKVEEFSAPPPTSHVQDSPVAKLEDAQKDPLDSGSPQTTVPTADGVAEESIHLEEKTQENEKQADEKTETVEESVPHVPPVSTQPENPAVPVVPTEGLKPEDKPSGEVKTETVVAPAIQDSSSKPAVIESVTAADKDPTVLSTNPAAFLKAPRAASEDSKKPQEERRCCNIL